MKDNLRLTNTMRSNGVTNLFDALQIFLLFFLANLHSRKYLRK